MSNSKDPDTPDRSGTSGTGTARRGLVRTAAAAAVALCITSCAPMPAPAEEPVSIVSAYWGADDAINAPAGTPGALGASVPAPICPAATSADGVPVTFSSRLDPESVAPQRFRVNGVQPVCATVLPAVEPNELFTVLLLGQFASTAAGDRTVTVTAQGLRASDGRAVDAAATSEPFGSGERVVLAEFKRRPPGPSVFDWISSPADALVAAYDVGDDQCPAGSSAVVRVVFEGGIAPARSGAALLDAADLRAFTVTSDANGDAVHPIAFGDQTGASGPDRDNILDLCLDRVPPPPLRVGVAAGTVLDPSGSPNPESSTPIRPIS